MVVEFCVGNFRSISAEQSLSFEASSGEQLSSALLIDAAKPDSPLLASLFLLGGNASGKSNICRAIQALRDLTINSATRLNRGQLIPQIEPNRLIAANSGQPCSFGLKLLLDGELWEYRIEVDAVAVRRESLRKRANSARARWSEVFSRTDGAKSTWTANAPRLTPSFFESVRENCSVLSKAAADNIPAILPVYDAIANIKIRNLADPPIDVVRQAIESAQPNDKDPFVFKWLAKLVACADIQVNQIELEKSATAIGDIVREGRALYRSLESDSRAVSEFSAQDLKFLVSRDDGSEIGFEIGDLSDGTVRFLALIINILQAFKDGSLLVLDEFDASLHTLLSIAVRDLLIDPDLNASGAQFIAVSHSDALLDSAKLRRDQIIAISRTEGVGTTWWALSDLDRKPKRDESFQRRYLNGGYGGIPRISDLRSNVLAALRGAHGASPNKDR